MGTMAAVRALTVSVPSCGCHRCVHSSGGWCWQPGQHGAGTLLKGPAMWTNDRTQARAGLPTAVGTLPVGMYACGCRVSPTVHDGGCQ